MAVNLTSKAIILRRTNYGEADRILSVITPDHCRLSVLARGVRREKSKLAGGIELFAVCELGLVRSSTNRDGLWTLTSSKIEAFYDHIMTDYNRMEFAYDAIRRINSFSCSVDSSEFFNILEQTLFALNNLTIDLRLIKTWFYLQVAKLCGSELNLLTDSNGMKLVEGASYDYEVGERVFVYTDDGGRFTTSVIKLARLLMANSATILHRLGSVDNTTIAEALYLATIAIESV